MTYRNRRLGKLASFRNALVKSSVLFLALLIGVAPMAMSAQERLGGANGTVVDSGGAVIPGATVTLRNVDTGVVTKAVSSPAGSFTFVNVLPGKYSVTVEAAGFQRFVQTNMNIETGVSANVFAKLATGEVTQTVTVEAQAVSLDTSSPAPGTTLEPKLLESLPVEVSGGSRSILTGPFTVTPGVGNGPDNQIGGGQSGSPYIYFNGLPEESEQFNESPPYDFVSEARVDRATFDAQWGWSDGDIKFQTRSGTNAYHGSAFYINRNSFFDSKGFGNTTTPSNHENNYGFSVGGPVRIPKIYDGRNRTFFYFSLDNFKENTATTGFGTVPTAAMKLGDFSGLETTNASGATVQAPIYNPASPDPNNPQQFSYNGVANVINPSLISPTTQALLSYLPNPNRTGTGPGLLAQNYYYNFSFPFSQNKWGVSLDEVLTPTQSLNFSMFVFSQNQYYNQNPPVFGPPTSGNPLNSYIHAVTPQKAETLNYTNLLRPNLAVTLGVGFFTQDQQSKSTAPATTIPAQVLTAAPAKGFPGVTFSGVDAPANLGENGFYNSNYAINYISFYNNWLWTKGKNSINIGVQGLNQHYGTYTCNCVGDFGFSGNTTTNNISGSTSSFTPNPYAGSPFASFLLGQVDNASLNYTPAQAKDWSQYGFYIQDNIKVSPKLTVNAGLRWDIQVPYHVDNNEQDFVTPTSLQTPNPAASGQPGVLTRYGHCSDCAGYTRANIHWDELGPRLGFSYALNHSTVVSGGYSLIRIAYNSFQNDGNAFGASNNFNSAGTNVPGFGSWDTNQLQFPPTPAFTPTSLTGQGVGFFDPKQSGINPYMETWMLSVQRELPWNIYFRGDYIGELGIHQMRGQHEQMNNLPEGAPEKYQGLLGEPANSAAAQAAGIQIPFANFTQLLGGNATVAQALRPYPQYLAIYDNFAYDGTNHYNALQLEADKRYSNGLFFLLSSTFQREIGNSSTEIQFVNAVQINPYNEKPESVVEGPSYLVSFTGSYELPFGLGKKFLNNRGFSGELLGGWQVAWAATYQGGNPYGVVAAGSPYGYGNRANRAPGIPIKTNSWSSVKRYIEGGLQGAYPTIIQQNGAFTDPGQYTVGDSAAAYSSLRGPAVPNENLSAFKNFAINKDVKVIFRVDFFNAFNRWNLGSTTMPSAGGAPCVDNNVTDGTFGKVTGLCGGGQRQGQASLRVEF